LPVSNKTVARLTAITVLIFITLVVTWPVLLHPKSMILGYSGDSTGTIYDLWTQKTFGLRLFGNHEVFWRGFPFGFSGNYSPGIANSLLTTIGFLLSFPLGEIAAYNFLIMAGVFLSGYMMYWACSSFGCKWYVSCWGGVAFTMFPFHQLAAGGWISQVQLGAIPVALVWSHQFLLLPDRRKFTKLFLLLGITAVTNAYVFLMVFVVIAATIVYGIPRHFKQLRTIKTQTRVKIVAMTLFSTSLIVLSIRVLDFRVVRSSAELDTYGLRLRELLKPTELATLLPRNIPRLLPPEYHGSNVVEVSQFLGFLTIGSLIVGLLFFIKKRELLATYSWLIFLGFVAVWIGASQGLHVMNYSLPVPADLINTFVPYWRVYSRFGVVVMAVAVLAACLFWSSLLDHIVKPLRYLIVIGMISISFFELWSPLPGKTTTFTTPSYVEVLKSPGINAVAMYPVVPDGHLVTYDQVFWQRLHTKKLMNGGPAGSAPYDFSMAFSNVENPELSTTLATAGIDAVVIDKNAYRAVNGREANVLDKRLESIFNDGQYQVFRVVNRRRTVAVWPIGVQATEIGSNGQTNRWTGNNFGLRYMAPRPGCYELRFNAPRSEGLASITFSKGSWSVKRDSGIDLVIKVDLDNKRGVIQAKSTAPLTKLPDGRQVAFYLSDIRSTRVSKSC
jgi:hypothetical protein